MPLLYGRVVLGLALLAAVIGVGTAGYMLIEGWSFLDAVYMAVTTVTTVGFREVRPLSTSGRVFTLLLILVGVGVAFYILTALVGAIIEGNLRQYFGVRRMISEIHRLRGHHIVCGFGRVGEEVARELKELRAPFVVIDLSQDAVERARQAGLLTVLGDATAEDTLTEAGIQHCRSLIAASDSDVANTYITLTAKSLRPDVFVVARVSTQKLEAKLRQAGADRIVSPYTMGGRHMALAALQPIMTDFIEMIAVGDQADRILAELEVDEDSGLAGRTLESALAGVRTAAVLAVRDARGDLRVGPPPSTVLQLGDKVVVVGREDELRSVGRINRPTIGSG